ncbi:MAG: tetratricopeptide repeat protein [Pirellulales bacterium]
MSAIPRSRFCCLATVWLVVAGVGCTATDRWMASKPPSSVTDHRQQRRERRQQEFDTDRDAVLFNAAAADADAGDANSAAETLERLVAKSPDHRQARLMLADLHLLDGDFPAARAQLEELLRRDQNDPQALRSMAELCDAQGQTEQAARLYQRVRELSAGSEVVAAGYQAVDEATGQSAAGLAIASDDESGQFDNSAAAVLREAERDIAEGRIESAVANFRRAIEAQPSNPQIAVSAAVTLLRYAQPDAAADVAALALERFPRSAALHRVLGVAHYRRGDFVSSQVALQQALSLDSGNPLTYFLLDRATEQLRSRQAVSAPLVAP